MTMRRQLFYTLPTIFLLVLLCEADLATVAADNSISNLYENLLQREYPGPAVFPNHQVERKAQRSPSLRLRFGRRGDPDLMPSAEKRWFGDVHQKPIRSPSLRLRFGRRSDPTMPLHSNFDTLMNSLAGGVANIDDNGLEQDYDGIGMGAAPASSGDGYETGYERAIRKPQRLRWGRSVPAEWPQKTNEHGMNYGDDLYENEQQLQRTDEFLNSLMNSEKFRNMVMNLQRYDGVNTAALAGIDAGAADEFSREIRKPAPLRLRWGRSTGGVTHTANADNVVAATSEKKITQNIAATAEKPSVGQNLETKN